MRASMSAKRVVPPPREPHRRGRASRRHCLRVDFTRVSDQWSTAQAGFLGQSTNASSEGPDVACCTIICRPRLRTKLAF